MRKIGFQFVEDRLAETGRHIACKYADFRTDRVAVLPQRIHESLEFGQSVRIGAEERIVRHGIEIRRRELNRAKLRHIPRDANAFAFCQVLSRDRTGGNAHGGLAS